MSTHPVTVVGAGPCGTLLAIRLAQRGYEVRLFEKQPDMRTTEVPAGRSINLALSDRGLKALHLIGMEKTIERYVIPMYGRMIHADGGKEPWLARYSGRTHEYIHSVSRPGLNTLLLHEAAKYPNLSMQFEQTCTAVDLKQATCRFVNAKGENTVVNSEVVFGTDGAGSVVRRSMFDQSSALRFDFSQDFLDHGYKELTIPSKDGAWKLEKNALHIWPRQQFMLIALPNLDGSFTATLFLPFDGKPGFNQLKDWESVKQFFSKTFSSAFAEMDTLEDDFFLHPTGILGTIKCAPWHAYGKVLLLGDAAHAVVPFYGQGMNCALEDVTVLDEIIDQYDGDWQKIFTVYQQTRKKDTDAIADLAVENYYEMRDHVDNDDFILKRKIEMLLEEKYPAYSSKYNLVTFNEDVPYSEAMRRGHAQDDFLLQYCKGKRSLEDVNLEEIIRQVL